MVGLLILYSVAGALTSIWLGIAAVYVSRSMGWENLISLPPTDLALFAFGALGPVAALWLVIGLLQNGLASQRQEKVLRALAAQARQTAGQTESQVRTLIQMQEESRRRSLIDGMDLVLKDLNGQAAVLAERLGMVSPDEADSLWARTISGDVWAFAYAFLTRAAAYPDFPDLLAERLAQDDISTAALQLFRRRYNMLVTSFEHSDADKVVRSVLEDGPLARLGDLFAQVDQTATRLRMMGEPAAQDPAEADASAEAFAAAPLGTEDAAPALDSAPDEDWRATAPVSAAPEPEPQPMEDSVTEAPLAAATAFAPPEPEPDDIAVAEPEPEPEPEPSRAAPSADREGWRGLANAADPVTSPEADPEPAPEPPSAPPEPPEDDFYEAPEPLPERRYNPMPDPDEAPPRSPEAESMDQTMARLQDALRRMNELDIGREPSKEPESERHEPDLLSRLEGRSDGDGRS